ncbi:hypothetical protein IFM53868_06348 [Aspergillus udagawae]|uniref:Alpha-1,3-mannosyltransferase n=1 Tax=Aspergillus udagawae TaxID=91492 RepID=A0ABQ1AZL5_9EURO|nr:hypothetical protein IFM53868_06348 [Aspergillus udagawae]GFG20607.1 hypothetical protein IFM5058_10699 [Aspergillus udagawae]
MTSTDRIREMSLRARTFKLLFEAWESLHPSLTNNLGIDLAQAIRAYEKLRFVLSKMSTLLFPWSMPLVGDHMDLHVRAYSGRRGIVITAGNNQAPYLLTSIPSIRWLGCDLPIEIMYLGDADLSPSFQADLESLPGVTIRDLSLMVNDDGWKLAGWAAKPFSILFSSFREVMLVDADALFFVDPEVLFDDASYQDTGTLFFRDRLFMPESKKEWLNKILPHPPSSKVKESRFWTGESGHMQESGVVLVDKWRHFVALLMVAKLNGPDRDTRDGKQGVYEMVYGDKETYWLGWEMVGDTDYTFHGGDAGTMGGIKEIQSQEEQNASNTIDNGSNIDSATICAPQLLHLDSRNRPIWFNGWLLPNKFKDQGQQHPGYFEAYLKEPRNIRDPSPWQLGDSNICCLTSEYLFNFSEDEKTVINMIINTWK